MAEFLKTLNGQWGNWSVLQLAICLAIIWRKEEKLFVNLSVKVGGMAPVFKEGFKFTVLQGGGMDRCMDGCKNLQKRTGAATEKPASSTSMLACVLKSCRELARKGSNFRVWFGKWFSLKLLFLKGYFQLGSSPQHVPRHTRLATAECGREEEKCLSRSPEPWTSCCCQENNWWEWVLLPFHIPFFI